MEKSAIYHQPCSAYAYAYDHETLHIKIRTKKDDVACVTLIFADPFDGAEEAGVYRMNFSEVAMKKIAQTDLHDYWLAAVKPPFRRLQYGFVIKGDQSEVFYGDRGFLPINKQTYAISDHFFKFPFIHDCDRFQAPDWVKSTVWYQIFPERFACGDSSISPVNALPWGSKDPGRDDFFGGDLQGILDHLDYLQELGINGIYLNPIFTAPTNHKYDTRDYKSIDPHFGTNETFARLVSEAHKRGIRIMLDAVFNHIGSSSPQWQDVVKNEAASPYKDWFHIRSFPVKEGTNGNFEGKKTLSYDTFAFTPKMPKLNTANPEVQQYLLDIATYWIREFDIDGWRLDVANEVDHAFWKKFHEAVLAVKSDVYIVGEVWHNAWNWLQGDEFHSVMNYPLTQSILGFFCEDSLTASETMYTVNAHFMTYEQPVNEVTFNLLDSHDTARVLTKAGGDKERVKEALVFLFAQAGAPCLYYGTEIGIDGDNDPLCRKCMVWEKQDQDDEMLAFTKQLIQFRKTYQALLTYGELKWLHADDHHKVLAFQKALNGEAMIFIFNRGQEAQIVPLSPYKVTLTDVWTGETQRAGQLIVPARAFRILKTDI
ncbi:MAG: glycoside hydrolase family 13 protein [Sporolactobacillus sp.]